MEAPVAGKHLVLIGFMGAGKSTVGAEVARRLDRPLVDTDGAVVEETRRSIRELFEDGSFRAIEERIVLKTLERGTPTVIALGGGAVESALVRDRLNRFAFTVFLDVDADEAWARATDGERPLARDESSFRDLYEARRPLYYEAADASARDGDAVVLAAGSIHLEPGALERLGELVPGQGPVALVADSHVAGMHGAVAQLALGARLASTHELPQREEAKTISSCERLWRELRLDRNGALAALGGGCTTDASGFVAATFLRGISWVPVPTTLVGQVDAAIGGKTALNLPEGKNLVGAFHWPARTVIDPGVLGTLPQPELAAGMAEVVKTGLLANEPFWEYPLPELVRRSAAFKTAVCLRDPFERGPRAVLNLGHTFAHALEAASDYALPHGDAVALGLKAALRLSGMSTAIVDDILRPRPARVDAGRAWAALKRDKKGEGVYVLLEGPGRPVVTTVPDADARRALDALIAS